ncbi:ATP-binding protein [Desulfobacula phenolica]|uniref:Oxygen sensor histidine kinase NreB n=1 Tax=Desulfobacula phenolica TaxID=90732 RepID=A0A1H2EKH5_9BACT|nr:ATP-binding protein [Desulfobacula phenolica]SDT95605.1 Signal transduction histidine kinase [Desulfobacula phenolica]
MFGFGFSLSRKLFVFICLILFLIIVPFFYIAKLSLTEFGTYAYAVNKKQIKDMSNSYLSRIVAEQADTYDQIFKRIKTASALLGSNATSVYHNIDVLCKVPIKGTLNFQKTQESRIFLNPQQEPVVICYWGKGAIGDEIKNELNALSHFEPILMKTKELVSESFATHIVTTSGIGCYYSLDAKSKNACYNFLVSTEFDLRNSEPATVFTKQEIKYRDTQWINIYKSNVIDGLLLTASTPIYDQTGELKGATGIDIPVENIVRDLTEGAVIAGMNILFAFLQNREGKIIAFPSEFFDLFGLDIDLRHDKNSSDIFNYNLKDSSIEAIQRISPGEPDFHRGVVELVINNEKYLLAIGCLESVEWYLVLVTREADLITSVNKTGFALKKTLAAIWTDFIRYCLLIVVIALMLVCFAIRIFISPIKQFIAATHRVASGDFTLIPQTGREDEVGKLFLSFNSMVEQLRISGKIENEHALELKHRIRLRTNELEKSNAQLIKIKNDLEKTVAKRTGQLKRLNEYLVYTEERERKAIASDLHDSVTQTLAMSIFKLKNIRESGTGMDEMDFSELQTYLEQAIKEIRSLIYQLSPPILDDFDIELALGFLIEEINAKHHSHIYYINNIEDQVSLDQAVKITLYRAVNELISNILKHSGSKNAEIEILNTKDAIQVRVEDKGVGFDVDMVMSKDSHGFGLHSLAERMENFGGKIQLDSKPGKGTKIYLIVPVSYNKDSEYEKN